MTSHPHPRDPRDTATDAEAADAATETADRDDLIRLAAGTAIDAQVLHERLEHIAAHVERLAGLRDIHQPAWLRRTTEEPRIPVIIAVLVAVALQGFVPHNLAFSPWWLLPALELLLLVVIILFRQTSIDRQAATLRALGLSLVGAASLATAWSAVRLINELLHNASSSSSVAHAGPLLRVGGGIWLTNVIVFALWYWEMDRGGPVARACGTHSHTDFLFAQMTAPEFVSKDWEPAFLDYLYLSFTNATAFSPTDTLPLSRWAKLTMMFQSAVSLATVALVVARAVNVLT
ncbi:MAG TPA: hypothetical protein VFR11_21140 [Micromonosporaceae bacterium]|nr:hypothetical protein [Micromonosporaceae bacterium]